uniref:Metallothionein n=1 Tax=Physella acuta TaxID=109671 RepID=D2XV88_PHYAT|nr:metallothionein [Physella acuta]
MSGKGPNCTEACTGEQCTCGRQLQVCCKTCKCEDNACKCGEGCTGPSTCKCESSDCACK